MANPDSSRTLAGEVVHAIEDSRNLTELAKAFARVADFGQQNHFLQWKEVPWTSDGGEYAKDIATAVCLRYAAAAHTAKGVDADELIPRGGTNDSRGANMVGSFLFSVLGVTTKGVWDDNDATPGSSRPKRQVRTKEQLATRRNKFYADVSSALASTRGNAVLANSINQSIKYYADQAVASSSSSSAPSVSPPSSPSPSPSPPSSSGFDPFFAATPLPPDRGSDPSPGFMSFLTTAASNQAKIEAFKQRMAKPRNGQDLDETMRDMPDPALIGGDLRSSGLIDRVALARTIATWPGAFLGLRSGEPRVGWVSRGVDGVAQPKIYFDNLLDLFGLPYVSTERNPVGILMAARSLVKTHLAGDSKAFDDAKAAYDGQLLAVPEAENVRLRETINSCDVKVAALEEEVRMVKADAAAAAAAAASRIYTQDELNDKISVFTKGAQQMLEASQRLVAKREKEIIALNAAVAAAAATPATAKFAQAAIDKAVADEQAKWQAGLKVANDTVAAHVATIAALRAAPAITQGDVDNAVAKEAAKWKADLQLANDKVSALDATNAKHATTIAAMLATAASSSSSLPPPPPPVDLFFGWLNPGGLDTTRVAMYEAEQERAHLMEAVAKKDAIMLPHLYVHSLAALTIARQLDLPTPRTFNSAALALVQIVQCMQ